MQMSIRALAEVRAVSVSTATRSAAPRWFPVFLALLTLYGAAFIPAVARAGGTVADCSEGALLGALSGNGTVLFGGDCSITLSQPITIVAGSTVTIDAQGHKVTLSGSNAVSLFKVSGNLTLVGL